MKEPSESIINITDSTVKEYDSKEETKKTPKYFNLHVVEEKMKYMI